VAEIRPTISTHVLDTSLGRPAAGIHVSLFRLDERRGPTLLAEAVTDGNGRVADLVRQPLEAGDYRLRSEARDVDGSFFRAVSVEFRITDTSRSYHVPLLVAPFGLTTYLGS
jgi:5-hydroxyisourate hydrolase